MWILIVIWSRSTFNLHCRAITKPKSEHKTITGNQHVKSRQVALSSNRRDRKERESSFGFSVSSLTHSVELNVKKGKKISAGERNQQTQAMLKFQLNSVRVQETTRNLNRLGIFFAVSPLESLERRRIFKASESAMIYSAK